VRADDAALFAASVAIDGTPFRVLSPADQVLHACAHVFQDSDLSEMLRDVSDIEALVREHGPPAGFGEDLVARARLHGLGRALWYGLDFAADLFGAPVRREVREALAFAAPGGMARLAMRQLGERSLLPGSPDRLPSATKGIVQRLLFLRYLLLRFPFWLLVRHAAAKGARRLTRTPANPD
jgi:hypothetical protein